PIATMSLFNAKPITAIVASAIVAGTGTYFVQQSETNRLRRQTRSLLEQQGRMIEERDGALTAASAKEGELARSRSENNDLLRLRGEIGTLRAQVKELEKLRQQNRQLQASL